MTAHADATLPSIAALREVMAEVELPDEDRVLSPFTGLGRKHWVAVADDLLLSVNRYASPAGSRFHLPGPPSQQGVAGDGLEAFARTFLLAAFLVRGAEGQDPHGHLDRYLSGVRSGTAAWGHEDPEAWPAIGHVGRDGQTHVEAASIALSLHLTRQWTWERLSHSEQDRVAGWLASGLDKEPSSNNWYLFPLTIASFLEAVGRGDDRTSLAIDRGLSLIEEWYRGEGWYSDGDGEAFDHYIGWALHLYPLLHAMLRENSELLERLRGRLRTFLHTFTQTFDLLGAPIYQGRSLTYRTGTLAAVAMGEVLEATPLRHGQSRRLLSANLRYFLERGATKDGIFTLGWHGTHPATVQSYSGPGSPYWASKGFAALLLPATHPVWTATEELPSESDTDHVVPIAPVGLMIQRTTDGLVRLHNHGSDHVKPHQGEGSLPDPLYGRFAYSTRTGPTCLHNPTDNDLQVTVRGIASVRRRIHAVATGPDWVASWHAPRFPVAAPFDASPQALGGPVLPSARIDSVTLAHGAEEVRIHRLRGLPPGAAVRLSGYAVAVDRPEEILASTQAAWAGTSAPDSLRSEVRGLHGWDYGSINVAPGGTAFGSWALVPELHGRTPSDRARSDMLLVAAVRLTAQPQHEAPLEVQATVHDHAVTVTWAGGSISTVDLDDIPWPMRL
ncbi:DUF2264 domain-containing protein [Brachybacterium alimentarium]|uniref:DUF2264 domain-containing protein n=1 Tax=Brachybacterium alimentarium TaxID=47845 RepID=UPI003FD027FA